MNFTTLLVFLGIVTTPLLTAQSQPTNDPLEGLRPYLIGISVPDAEQAARWYEQKLGFKLYGATTTDDGGKTVVVERGSIAIELFESKDSSTRPQRSVSGRPLGITKFAFAVDDLDTALAEMKRQGVQVDRGITDLKALNVRFFLIEDNNGNTIQIFQGKKLHTKDEAESDSHRLQNEKTAITLLEGEWVDGLNSANVDKIAAVLADDFARPAPDYGQFVTKADLLPFYRTHLLSQPRHRRIEDLTVTLYGSAAIARGKVVATSPEGRVISTQLFTDVFIRRNEKWQAVSAQENRVAAKEQP